MWDDVKYDVMHGITDIAASEVDANITWNQDEITPNDKMFETQFPGLGYGNDIVEHSEDIYNEWTVKFHGNMDNPCEMTIQEMIDRYGTETKVVANQCTINGTGGQLVYQAEVTGIPLNSIIETLGLHENASIFTSIGVDAYSIVPLYTEVMMRSNPLLVVEINGEPLADAQGYPLMLWAGGGLSGGHFTKHLSEIKIDNDAGSQDYALDLTGTYGKVMNTPNIGVLTAETGQIFSIGEPVHLEGYAHAFDETITKIEFSFDHGETWIEVPTADTDNERWVYWKMDINSITEPGAYLMELRATCVDKSGEVHTNDNIPKFLMNVQ